MAILPVIPIAGLAAPASAAKPAPKWVAVADESPGDPSYDVLWGGPANITASGDRYAVIECDNPSGHLLWRSEIIDLAVNPSTTMMGPHQSEGDYYFPCVVKLLSDNQRKTVASSTFVAHST